MKPSDKFLNTMNMGPRYVAGNKMSNVDQQQPGRIVQALNSDKSVVSYRAVVGAMMLIITGLVGFYGNRLMDGQDNMQRMLGRVQVNLATNTGKIADQDARLGRVETSVQNLYANQNEITQRVTIIETRQGMH